MLVKKNRETIYHKSIQSDEKIELVHSGEDFFSRLMGIIAAAKTELHLQTYIFEKDETGIRVVNALKEAAARHVKIYVILDGYGSNSLPKSFTKDLSQHGINIRFFSLFASLNFHLGRRLHHKVVVADGAVALIGGINIADKYRGTPNHEPWLDYAVQIKSNDIAAYLQHLCWNIYFKKEQVRIKEQKHIFQFLNKDIVRILQNDWLKGKNEISNAYIKAIRNAKTEVIIVGSYFLPGRKMKKALKKASNKGVKVKLILSGISDVPMIRKATAYLYSSLLKNKIELYEWHTSVLHGKVALVDNEWVTVGSFNLNYLSSYGSIEMNVAVNSPEFSKTLATHLKDVIAKCDNITIEKVKIQGGFVHTIRNWMAYHIVRIALILLTYGSYKRL